MSCKKAISLIMILLLLVGAGGCGTTKKASRQKQSAESNKGGKKNLSSVRLEYIAKYKELAIRQMKKYKIPASIILAQACLESADGRSTLATKANNHFGIKCHSSWKGKTYRRNDDRRNECFRKYPTIEDSYKDHSEFLKNGKRYSKLFSLPLRDYRKWAKGLKEAGYATDPHYAEVLIKIIEDYQLYRYDK